MPDDETTLEHRLLQNGCVVLYLNPFLMEEHSGLLVQSGWQFKEVYVGETGTINEFFDHVAMALEFPDYFGRNLDAFRDCLSDLTFREGLKLAFGLTRFDLVAKQDAAFANAVLDIFAEVERHCLMEGGRVLFLVQSSDPDIHFPVVGATPVLWNFEEWLDSKRKGQKR
jgi:RNAse (barnase) inhibitor barstar